MYYIAYGSNINPIQMANLCNNPVFIGTGLLHDYEMDFYATTKNPKTANVYADVVYNNTGNTSDTPVVVWKIENEKDLGMLDSFEGYPNLYTKIENCRVTLSNGEEITGFLYQMHKNRGGISAPSNKYAHTILYGYRFFNMDDNYLFSRRGLNIKSSKMT